MKTNEQICALIKSAQDINDPHRHYAIEDIINEIANFHMKRHLYKYTRNITVSGVDADDLQQIFLIGCERAIHTTRTDIGDPLMFIIQKGKWEVISELRKHYRYHLRQYCHKCNNNTRVYEVSGIPTCPKCGQTGHQIERIQHNISDDGTIINQVVADGEFEDALASEEIVYEFRARLSGRRLDVFELMVEKGFDRDSCTNYIKEIADTLGVTPANINLRLRQIKDEWNVYYNVLDR